MRHNVRGYLKNLSNEKIIENNKWRVVFSGCNHRAMMTDRELHNPIEAQFNAATLHKEILARIILVTAMSLLGSLSVGIAYAQLQQQEEWLLYQNVTYGVSILYPSNWTQQNSTGTADDRFIYVSDFFSPEETDGYFAYVTIAIDSMPNNTNIESYRNQSIDIYRQDPEFQEFQLLSSSMGNFTLAGMPAYSFEIAYTDLEFGPQNMLEVGRIFDNRVYYIQYFADTPIYQKYLPIAERMIESFQIMQ